MTYDEALTWYRSFEKFGVVPGLERVRLLCSRLGDPQRSFDCVHVTGTNGKGSVCTETANALIAAGYRTALYTSPEVLDFRERMRVNGEMIAKDRLCSLTEKVRDAVEGLRDGGVYPTQFEVLTAAAFLWFAESGCDIAVLETGLGGRFDATNLIDPPLVCAITSVSLDHTAILGDTYAEIAFEKCGIIKEGADVVVPCDVREDVKKEIRAAAEPKGCPVYYTDPRDCFEVVSRDIRGTQVLFEGRGMLIPFAGEHQLRNAALTVRICRSLSAKGYPVTSEHIAEGISRSRIPARTEIISSDPLVILDGCHNDASTAALSETLAGELSDKRIIAVMGMMADKDCRTAVNNLACRFSRVITVKPSNPRSIGADALAALIREAGTEAYPADSPEDGIDAALALLPEYDAMVVCGSLYLAADIREYLLSRS